PPAATAYPQQILPYNYSLILGNTGDTDQNVELRVTSPQEARLRGSAGFNYFHDLSYNLPSLVGETGFLLASPVSYFENHTYGVFGSATFDIVDKLSLTGEG